MAVGNVYDQNETSRIESLLKTENAMMQGVDKEKQFSDKKVLQYVLALAGIVVLLVGFKFIVNKK